MLNDSGSVTSATIFKTTYPQGRQDPNKSGSKNSRNTQPYKQANNMTQNHVKQAANQNAVSVWDLCIPATSAEAYIDRKQGKPDGLRIYPASAPLFKIQAQNVAGYLVVPCWAEGKLQTLQFIPPHGGNKLIVPRASFGKGFFTVGNIESAENIYVVEGVGQAWATTNADPRSAAAVSFGAARMKAVAQALARFAH